MVNPSVNRWRLAIDWMGIGLAPEMTDRIFDLFTQGPQRAGDSQSGLGLGLRHRDVLQQPAEGLAQWPDQLSPA